MPETLLATFHCDEMLLGLEVESVQEVLRDQTLIHVPRAPRGVAGMISLRGRILAVTDVRTRMGLPPAAHADNAYYIVRGPEGLDVLLVDSAGLVVGVHTDDIMGVPDTTPTQIARQVRGAYQVDGQPLLVVDLNRILDTADEVGGDAS